MYINKRLYFVVAGIILLFIAGYKSAFLFTLAQFALLLTSGILFYEIFLLFISTKKAITCRRICPGRFSNGDDNKIELILENRYPVSVNIHIIDEIPDVFQYRDFSLATKMDRRSSQSLTYTLRPVKRGVYKFGKVNVFVSSTTGLVSRRFKAGEPFDVKVYPSFLYLQQYELHAASDRLTAQGNKRIRKVGQQLEPDHIKEYIKGDDYRIINWKATARRSKLMVNVFQDEREQNVYCVIDKGRTMQSAFEGMTLLDYSINASLALSYVSMIKGDKAGLITFEKNFETLIPASKTPGQMKKIQETLYNQATTFAETDFSVLYQQVTKDIKNRSLLLIFTNFDSVQAMQRQLSFLSILARKHTVVVIFFENTELKELSSMIPRSKEEIYETTIAEKFNYEKSLIVNKLRNKNILSLLSHPSNLTINVINKYLEIKAKGIY